MIRLIIALLFAYTASVVAGPIEYQLLCKISDQSTDSKVGLILSFEGGAFAIENPDRGCKSDYVYRTSLNESSAPLIFSYPTSEDMGLNSQIMIFAASIKDGSAEYIGSVPAGASELQDGSYKDIQQSGGSIYESIYRIEGREVLTLTSGKELIISGEQCVYKEKSGGVCKKMRGSFKNPVCVFNYGSRKILANVQECSDMSREF
ncbi:hypothetical protein C1X59_02375 [Pseudomonas sp. FW215-R2]|uniref:hypothetical protein n=1 Tax=unclassified Pseudomonas TaxID=196821 RepID=UPI000C88F01A|nr:MULTISPECIES: hypothetical protein [unclassified Pseudomonas]PMX04278.1 hypothetical protein C1X59_02375 [Pseudomonas sp. FW215-R2]PMX10050.1 hypothetical protein C1X60_11645 [Pseudomonas sp. FW215-L1]PMX26174.1 hypothetical protein C1X57_00545 [Pseudomonas sp. FW215-E1]PNA32905.1 hypothetical protein C1X58_00025 [Pseudomonas sp. FW215-R4]